MNFQYVIVNVWWYTLDVIYPQISIFLELSVAYVSENAGLSSIDFLVKIIDERPLSPEIKARETILWILKFGR